MLGAIIGDIVGSVHEFLAKPTKTKEFGPLFVEKSHLTDDTVCTVAIAEWLLELKAWGGDLSADGKPLGPLDIEVYDEEGNFLNSERVDINIEVKAADKPSPATFLREYGNRYPRRGYGGMFARWITDTSIGPYNSWGNGAPMRVSPVGWYAKTLDECLELAKISADVTHNHPQAVKGAQVVAMFIFLARQKKAEYAAGRKRISWKVVKAEIIEEILERLDDDRYYGHILSCDIDDIRDGYSFKVSSKNTVPQALLCLREGKDFEDVIRNAISLGGDADTLAAIAGSMAEVVYDIPDEIMLEAFSRVDDNIRKILMKFEREVMLSGIIVDEEG